jgi:uncharacterized protein (TIGR00375 family)
MKEIFADLHIHIGKTWSGKPVKISASSDLTISNIARVASMEKGIEMVGIIDCHVPEIQKELRYYIANGEAVEHPGGGIIYKDTLIILGCEIEVKDEGYQPAHYLCYFPTLEYIGLFTDWLKGAMKNIHLSSQRLYRSTKELQDKVKELEGIFIPAHIFTPYKGIYGSAVQKMEEICHLDKIDAVELGLSGDTDMADTIDELSQFSFVTNSDAHSLRKIAREYQKMYVEEASFSELYFALHHQKGRKILANYGLSPQLGKYHHSVCLNCNTAFNEFIPDCPVCNGKVLRGVWNRVQELADRATPKHPHHRPPYIPQIPLEFYPGIGKKTHEKLLELYGTEMNILHHVPIEQIESDFGTTLATYIQLGRVGQLSHKPGGGGKYGKVINNQQKPCI